MNLPNLPAIPDIKHLDQLRAETPGCAGRIHLNNAGAALMPLPVVKTIQEYLTLESQIGGYEAEAATIDALTGAYDAVANLLGTRIRNIAFTENATTSFTQALSSVPFESGDIILTTRNDYASNQIQFLSLQGRFGAEVIRAPDSEQGGVDIHAMAKLIRRRRPRIVCVTHIPTNSGLVQDVEAIGAVCQEEGVLYLVDACQSVGQMPIDVKQIGCDFLSVTARKFLRGPRGSGFLYVSDRILEDGMAPLFPDMGGADWFAPDAYRLVKSAKRFENWEFAYALILGTGEAARYATAIGLEPIKHRVTALAARTRLLINEIDGMRVLDRGDVLSGIVSVAVGDRNPADIVAALRLKGINLSSQIRTSAVIDYDDKGVAASLRIAPHYYNTEDELDTTVAALRDLLSS